jgi:hypothetical protein
VNAEQQAHDDAFRIVLLGVELVPARNFLRYRATLFAGGREVRTLTHMGPRRISDPKPVEDLRALLLQVLAPPHVLAAYGRGWRDLLVQTMPAPALRELRILDLLRTATALRPELPARANLPQLMRAFGLQADPDAESALSPVHEDLLWAIIAEAGRTGLDWPGLLRAAEALGRPKVDFAPYAFTAETLAALPAVPGVYVMYDRDNAPLYVGKSANLNRRLNEYFRPSRAMPPKLQAIRERIQRFAVHAVGSELEALLTENRLIRRHHPPLNTQLQVKEGVGRYGAPLLPVALVLPSARAGAVEVFLVGARQRAVQCRLPRRRNAGRAFEHVAAWSRDPRRPLRRAAGITDWGVEGAELCQRYFGRYRDRLHWVEWSDGRAPADLLAAVRVLADALATDPHESARLRWLQPE